MGGDCTRLRALIVAEGRGAGDGSDGCLRTFGAPRYEPTSIPAPRHWAHRLRTFGADDEAQSPNLLYLDFEAAAFLADFVLFGPPDGVEAVIEGFGLLELDFAEVLFLGGQADFVAVHLVGFDFEDLHPLGSEELRSVLPSLRQAIFLILVRLPIMFQG